MGADVSKEVKDLKELARTIQRALSRDDGWVQDHAEALAELVDEAPADSLPAQLATAERKAFIWSDGYHDKAIAKIESSLEVLTMLDPQTRGWMEQTAARIAHQWGHGTSVLEDLQRQVCTRTIAHATSSSPSTGSPPPDSRSAGARHRQSAHPGPSLRRGFLQHFEDVVAHLHHDSSANQFEQALADSARRDRPFDRAQR